MTEEKVTGKIKNLPDLSGNTPGRNEAEAAALK